jgi:hypothetical protein
MNVESAERLAKKINTFDDIEEFYKEYKEAERLFYSRKEEHYKKAVPYQSEEF